ncbi:Salicylate hydroxylase [Akanthomyces lecanii RCEF 1005]|uniref:Salicylate hydroxylase n=1 Tax=Akanthomyces lecanii RCEF 1005 TaxID=1081108 RepID=A0A168GFS5_CORDF|nr:Salicylate hydroxylase [Akanthomyces lecanii RCEF 1005]
MAAPDTTADSLKCLLGTTIGLITIAVVFRFVARPQQKAHVRVDDWLTVPVLNSSARPNSVQSQIAFIAGSSCYLHMISIRSLGYSTFEVSKEEVKEHVKESQTVQLLMRLRLDLLDHLTDVPHKQCDVDQVRRQYAAFGPRIHKILDLASEAPYIWKLSDIPALEIWQSSGSRVVLLGDAAHAMLPYAAMGAASGIEDSLCIAECIESAQTIDAALDSFEKIRKPRATFITEVGHHNMNMIHLPDGPEQKARDDTFIKSAPKSDAQTPVPTIVPNEDNHGRRLEDFDPPAVATGSFVPSTRAYLLEYDVYLHTVAYLKAMAA